MAADFPSAIANINRPTANTKRNAPGYEGHALHAKLADEIEAIEGVIGVTGSTVPTSIEKRLADVQAVAQLAADAHVVVKVDAPSGGTTSDHAKFQTAIADAGVGGAVQLVPGATYLTDRKITLLQGQRLIGNGATLKRKPQVISSTTTGITSGVTNTITLAPGGGALFSVGQQINIFNGAEYGTQPLTIASIVGDVITTATAFFLSAGSPWSGTTVVCSAYITLYTGGDATIDGLIIDGNKSNWTYSRWETVIELEALNSNNCVQNCRIVNAPGEGIMEGGVVAFGSVNNRFLNNTIGEINGNGIHLSYSTGTVVSGNNILNCNLNGAAVGHNGGAVTLSNSINHAVIAGNYLSTSRAGVGQISSSDNSNVLICGNTMVNMSTYFVEARGATMGLTDLVITGNRFIGTLAAAAENASVSIQDTGSGWVKRVSVTDNQFYNAALVMSRVDGATVSGNQFECEYSASDQYHNAVNLTVTKDITVSGNSMKNGNAGVLINQATENVVVIGNTIRNPYYYGIYGVGNSSNTTILIADNTITSDNNVNSGSFQSIGVGPKSTVRGNSIVLTAGYCGIRLNGVANAIVQGNVVRAPSSGKSIRVDGASTGYVVAENQVSHAIVDTPAVGVRVANNDIIT